MVFKQKKRGNSGQAAPVKPLPVGDGLTPDIGLDSLSKE